MINTRSHREIVCSLLFILILPSLYVFGDPNVVEFTAQMWNLNNASIADHLGRKSLLGTAWLENVVFSNGTIEVDIAVSGARSYPGIIFRMQPGGDYERFYVRPHRAGLYPDALQYVPVFNGVAGWQLYHGDGFTSGATLPRDQWVHLKMEIKGTQARVFLGDSKEPTLVIHELKHGHSKGAIGLMGPKDGTAYFSNFRYESIEDLKFNKPPQTVTPDGTLIHWDISKPFPADQIDCTKYPHFFTIFQSEWQSVEAETSGLVNISKYVKRPGPEPSVVFAKTVFYCEQEQSVKLIFGYSDDVTVFHNAKPWFSGKSGYRSRDPSFVGAIGLHDTVYLPMQKGLNEIFLMVTESFGGWGFMGRTEPALKPPVRKHDALTKLWETPAEFKVPESVLYDPTRKTLYVSSFNKVGYTKPRQGFISKLSLDGKVENLKWVTDLDGPCGMGIDNDQLYVVESAGYLVEIDIASGTISNRQRIPNTKFLNDLAIDRSGVIYMTNTTPVPGATDIYRFAQNHVDNWKNEDELLRNNGLFIHGDQLIVGNSGDGFIKQIGLKDGVLENIICLGAGVNDGIRVDNQGNFLLSHWEGRVYRVSPSGDDVVEILDTSHLGHNCADFEFIKDKNLLVIPTFLGNSVAAYRLETG